jgi:BirA family biotin operon repressor/biotin-[acetyl-CoA-carboxylase] ligase
MTNSKEITPDLIQYIIDQEEIPLRSRIFDPDTVQAVFRYGALVGSVIEQHKHIPRGMDRARQLIIKAEKSNRSFQSGTVILADRMDNSKGRFQRHWNAPEGGLWLTLILVNTLLPENSRLYPLATGIACCEAIQQYGIPASLKWVNDIQVDGKKIGGILTETTIGKYSGEEYILVGIGINANNDNFPAEIADTAVAMRTCVHKNIDMTELAARLLTKLCWNIGLLHHEEVRQLETNDGTERAADSTVTKEHHENLLLASYSKLTDIFNRRVLFGFDVQKSPQFKATVIGLDKTGGLVLRMDDGSTVVEHSGEIIYLD